MKDRTIAIIDDDDSMLVLLEKLVERAGFRSVNFRQPSKALAYFDEPGHTPPAMIIADMTMPAMDGISLLKEVKKRPATKAVPFLFLSALNDTAVLVNAFEQGAVDYFIKPIKTELFIAKIRSMTDAFETSARQAATLATGQLGDQSFDEILELCDRESLNGFVRIAHEDGQEGLIRFIKGMPERIEIYDTRRILVSCDADAFEAMRAWTSGQFEVRRGSADESDKD